MFGESEDYRMFEEAYRVIKQYMRRGWVTNFIYCKTSHLHSSDDKDAVLGYYSMLNDK
jgi:hypothetical protein